MVVWVIGLAGAGKTVIARELHKKLRSRKPSVVFLDGDHVRSIMGDDLGYTVDDRLRNAERICRLCSYLDAQGIDVICAVLAISHESLEWNRANYSSYFEVFIDVPMSVLEQRDQKGLYSGARRGEVSNVVGVDIPFRHPPCPDLVIDNSEERTTPERHAQRIVDAMGARSRGS